MENMKIIELDPPKKHLGWIMFLYLFGLFLGALSTGIITPVRTIIQNSLGVSDQAGIWMITIYTLFYAAVIPISGKIADRIGRKNVYIVSIALFGIGSVICGLSANIGSFAVLLIGRMTQALGAGGIMPIATAEFGTGFPEKKRGMALGLVGGIYGVANVLGATAGSGILDIFGNDLWQWIFYINVPICLFIVIGSIFVIPNSKNETTEKIDKLGILVMTVLILCLLYGLKNIDFFHFTSSLKQTNVYPFLIATVLLLPLFIFIEKRAKDPIFHIEYMKNSQIVLTLLMSLLIGASMMVMIFIPQFAENALKIPAGDGGYFVLILGLFAGVAAPLSGITIDKIGPKPVLGTGFLISFSGCLYLAFIATVHINIVNIIISLVLIGLGLGLSMGTPLNYMMLRQTKDEESNSALATLSLVRSIGTALAPAIMVGFIVQASLGIQGDLMKTMPPVPPTPNMEQQEELNTIVNHLKGTNDEIDEMLAKVNFDTMEANSISMESIGENVKLPDDLLKQMQFSDVTTIVDCSKDMATYMFDENTPAVIEKIQDGINEGIRGIGDGISGVDTGISEMKKGVAQMSTAKAKIQQGINGMTKGISGMESGLAQQNQAIEGIKNAMNGRDNTEATPPPQALSYSSESSTEDPGINDPPTTPDPPQEPENPIAPEEPAEPENPQPGNPDTPQQPEKPTPPMDPSVMKEKLAKLEAARDELSTKLASTKSQKAQMQSALSKMSKEQKQLEAAIKKAQEQKDEMEQAQTLMISMRDDIPQTFGQVKNQYLKDIDDESDKIETVYQKDLNKGFKNMYICGAVFNFIGFILLLFYKDNNKKMKVE